MEKITNQEVKSNMLISTTLNFLIPFKDFHLVSQDYEINKSVLENWTIGRIKVPEFINETEMRDWIIAVDFIIKSESFVISGPTLPYYYAFGDKAYYTKQLSIEDINGIVYKIPERNYYNKNAQPLDLLDTKKLYDYTKEYANFYLKIDTYGSCTFNKKVDEKYFFQDINMCGIVEFLLNYESATYLPPKEQMIFGIKTDNYSYEDDFDECNAYWKFKDSEKSNKVIIIESEINVHKKKSQIEYFDSWRMWHEKFIINNKLYFILFQTDEMGDENINDFFKTLIHDLSEEKYTTDSFSCLIDEYINLKLLLRDGKINCFSDALSK